MANWLYVQLKWWYMFDWFCLLKCWMSQYDVDVYPCIVSCSLAGSMFVICCWNRVRRQTKLAPLSLLRVPIKSSDRSLSFYLCLSLLWCSMSVPNDTGVRRNASISLSLYSNKTTQIIKNKNTRRSNKIRFDAEVEKRFARKLVRKNIVKRTHWWPWAWHLTIASP